MSSSTRILQVGLGPIGVRMAQGHRMTTTMKHTFLAVTALVCTGGPWLGTAAAATYYVDFEAGADTNAGTSPQAPFKRAPGDPQATDTAKAVALSAGDTVILKGGVVYRGTIRLDRSGQPGSPIVFDGNTAGTFGTGKAVIDGSKAVTGWKRCASAEEAKGNPRWQEILYADLGKVPGWRDLNLCAGGQALPVAQDPDPSDPFFQERVGEFHRSASKMQSTYPGKLYFEKGSSGNRTTPLIGITRGQATVIDPIKGGAFTIELDEPVEIAAIGVMQNPKYDPVKEVAFLADGKQQLTVELTKGHPKMQQFNLPQPVTARKLTFKLLSPHAGAKGTWTKINQVAAFTADGKNVLNHELLTVITDEKGLVQQDAHSYDGMTVGFHGGANAIAYSQVRRYDPATHRLYLDYYSGSVYDETKYAFFNSVRLIDTPGEWSVEATGKETARLFLMSDKLEGDPPVDVGYSVRGMAVELAQASHAIVKGFLIRQQGGGKAAGVSVNGGRDVTVSDCEITLVAGHAGVSAVSTEGIVVENCHVHHCTGHTRGIVLRLCKNVSTRHCRLIKNTSTALDYYDCQGGDCRDNTVTDHLGMHANGLTFYLGCKDLVIERNHVYNSNVCLTIQQCENIVIRNNILDAAGQSLCVGIWTAAPFRNVQFLNNTFVNASRANAWQAGVFSNNAGPEGLVFRNNIIDGLSGTLPATYEHNLYTRWGANQAEHKLGTGELYEPDLQKVFMDSEKRDYRLKPGSAAVDAGLAADVTDDVGGGKRPIGKAIDIGAWEFGGE